MLEILHNENGLDDVEPPGSRLATRWREDAYIFQFGLDGVTGTGVGSKMTECDAL